MATKLGALAVLTIVAFALGRLAPGDPAEILLRAGGDTPTVEAIAAERARLGLDQPLLEQYARWIGRVACCLDTGQSYQTSRPVRDELFPRLANTLVLATSAAALGAIAIAAGAIGGHWSRRRGVRPLIHVAAIASIAAPSFVAGLVLIDLFAVRLGWLPSSGAAGWRYLVLPAATMALAAWGGPFELLRSQLDRAATADFVAAARTRGLPERVVILNYLTAAALRPCIPAFGAALAQLIAGSVVIESVFAWPGLGRWAIDAVIRRDYPVLQAYLVVVGAAFLVIGIVTDALHRRLDPRPRHA